jgi:dTDP-4-amino-4,6-dideoxygalactose transaminase
VIPFNKPYLTGRESHYVDEVISLGRLAGNGDFTKKCHERLHTEYGFQHPFLTTSATSALEMAALLADLQEGDEVILPSFTFVATATPFALRGATLIFVDGLPEHPNMDVAQLERLITPKTKVIVAMHYAGMACDMDTIMALAEQHKLLVIEDAAHSIGSFYKGKALGTFGHLAAFSFHETKNISSGQGGMLVVNDERFLERAAILWDRGTNRNSFERGQVDAYSWHDHGSNFYPSEITSAFLLAQLEDRAFIETERARIWNTYANELKSLESNGYLLPAVNDVQTNNHHIFYLVSPSMERRARLIEHLGKHGILAVFHYTSLHSSAFMRAQNKPIPALPNADFFSEHLLRLPLFVGLTEAEQQTIIEAVLGFEKG